MLFNKTDLQTTFSYNMVALVDKTPTELNLKDCIKIYVEYNKKCIIREITFDLNKVNNRLEIVNGLLKALEDIDNIIALIKSSNSSADAQIKMIDKYKFTEAQAKAIVDMKLGRLANLEKIEIQEEKANLEKEIKRLNDILKNPIAELRLRLNNIVSIYGDDRRTELTQINITKEKKEEVYVEPEKCMVIMTASGSIKRVPITTYKVQKRNGKGIKTQEDITSSIIRTNTVDKLMVFTNKGKMYRLLVNDIPEGTNTSKGISIKNLITFEANEEPQIIYSIYKDTNAKYVFFVTKKGVVKKTPLSEYTETKRKNGISTINLREGDSLAAATLVEDEEVILVTKNGRALRFKSSDVATSSRASIGVKGITLNDGDEVLTALPIRDQNDLLAMFGTDGCGKRIKEIPLQQKGGKGCVYYKSTVAGVSMVNPEDSILVMGNKSSICVKASDLPELEHAASGNCIIKDNKILSVSKI